MSESNRTLSELKYKQVYFFDLDGTIYLGNKLFDSVLELIDLLIRRNKNFYFLSNNSSLSTEDYLKKLNKFKLNITIDNIIISTHPTISYLKENQFKKIYLLGTKSLESEFIKNGFKNTDKDPQILVLGFDKELTYKKLEKAAYFLQEGLPFIATHPDKKCPTQRGYIPDTGAMIALLFESTGKTPLIFGKPNKEMLLFKLREIGVSPKDAVIIGDRLYTDIRMGIEAGVTTCCVLSGETTLEMIEESEYKPDFVINGIWELYNEIK